MKINKINLVNWLNIKAKEKNKRKTGEKSKKEWETENSKADTLYKLRKKKEVGCMKEEEDAKRVLTSIWVQEAG